MRSLPTTFMQKKRHNIWILLMSLALFLLAAVLRIFLHVRLPRTLAVSGVIIQSVLANPLAGPNIIGVNVGAGFFAVLCAAFLPRWPAAVPTAAFLGALAAMLLVYAIARATRASRIALVLSGAAMKSLAVPGTYILAGILLAFSLHCEMDLMSLGDDTAKSVGLRVGKFRLLLLLTASVLAGAAVSFAGFLGFAGLIVPHGARFFVGSESRWLLPVSALSGAAFVCVCDVLARILFAPFELPVGIVMSFLGGPFFLYLLIRRKGGRTDNG